MKKKEYHQKNYLNRVIPTWHEALIPIAIGVAFGVIISYTDIIMHDFYVKDIIGTCYAENQEHFCQKIRERHGLPINAQIELGDAYWMIQKVHAYSIGLLLFFLKIAFQVGTKGWKSVTGTVMFTAFMWGFTSFALFIFGVVDIGYYALRPDVEMPNELPWLNSSGVLEYTKYFGEDPEMVEKNDLYLTFLLGLGIIGAFWFLLIRDARKIKKHMPSYHF